MPRKNPSAWIYVSLLIYLFVVGVGGAVVLIAIFPSEKNDQLVFQFAYLSLPASQGLILLAFLAGISGSFLHAGQSLITYIGNESFKSTWIAWYCLRPWIGGVLGFAIYFALCAGLVSGSVSGAEAVNPYGVVALGLLGGWFSKITTDKLQEVFLTLFKTDEDKYRKDKVSEVQATIVSIDPSPVPTGTSEIVIKGNNFAKGAIVVVDGQEYASEFVSETEIKTTITHRPAAGTSVLIQVKNPPESNVDEAKVLFQ